MRANDLQDSGNNPVFRDRTAWARRLVIVFLCGLTSHTTLVAEASGGSGGFVPGGRELFSTDFSRALPGEFPDSLRKLRGSLTVVEKDGKRMLRASDSAEFLIPLPERLPERFTLEFDLITRADYNNEEIHFEGTPTFNRGPESANVLWYRSAISVLGGREEGNAYITIPAAIAAELEGGQPVELQVDVNGSTMTLYANGRQISSVSGVKFVRSRVLRVFLGGHDSDLNAVHLSRVRIAAASTGESVVEQRQSGLPVTTTATTGAPPTAVLERAVTGVAPDTRALPTTTTMPSIGSVVPQTRIPLPTDASGTTTAPTTTVLQRASTTAYSGGKEDDLEELEIERRTVQGVTSPLSTTPVVPSGAGTSPNTGLTTGGTTSYSGGKEDDLEELEIERRTVQGVTSPLTTTPQIPPGGVSPRDGGISVTQEPTGPLPR
jgi:hypothetical protein